MPSLPRAVPRPPASAPIAAGLLVAALIAAGLAVVNVAFREEVIPPCDEPTAAELDTTVEAAADWMARSLQDDGRYWYEYDRTTDIFSTSYHDVRHGGVTMSLYQVAADWSDTDAGRAAAVLVTADEGRSYIYDHLVTDGTITGFGSPRAELHLGAAALVIAGLVHRRIATGDTVDDDLLASLGEFMRLTLRDDGGMWFGARFDAQTETFEPTIGKTSTFYTGEAFWAFGLLANQFPDDGWDRDARAVARYIATKRDIEEEIANPPLADQWSAYGFAELSQFPLGMETREAELEYVRSLIDQYHGRLTREIGREADRVGDGTDEPDETVGQARGAAFGTTVEALSALWRLTSEDRAVADLNGQVRDDLVCGAAILAARQYSAERAAEWDRPPVVEGAWFFENVTRMDDQQHAMSGVLLARDAIGAPGKDAPVEPPTWDDVAPG